MVVEEEEHITTERRLLITLAGRRILLRRAVLSSILALLVAVTALTSLVSRVDAASSSLSTVAGSYVGELEGGLAGWSVALMGDVNGDGYGDFLVSARGADAGLTVNAGKVYLLFGQNSGWKQEVNISLANASFVGEHILDEAGSFVAGVGDVNGDGLSDFAIGAEFNDDGGNDAGKIYLFLGKRSGWSRDISLSTSDASFVGESAGDRAGYSVAGAGDVNGDGLSDFLVGAPGSDLGGPESGQVYLIFGRRDGWQRNVSLSFANASYVGEVSADQAGSAVSGGCDVSSDGFDDILIGSPYRDNGGRDRGEAYMVLGSPVGWTMRRSLYFADASFLGEHDDDKVGWSVACVNDMNGDESDEVAIGAPWNFSTADRAGQVYLFLGKSQNWSMRTPVSVSDSSFVGEAAYDRAGFSLSRGGDANGDGYGDLIIGAHTAKVGNKAEAGKAYVVAGQGRAWTRNISLSQAWRIYTGEQSGAWAGFSVSGGEDVDGDGYDDMLVGAPFYDTPSVMEAGKAYLALPDHNKKPSSITSIAFTYADSASTTSSVALGKPFYVQVVASDTDSTKRNLLPIQVRSSLGDHMGLVLDALETAPDSGIFRASGRAMDMSQRTHGWIRTVPGDVLIASPLPVGSPSASAALVFYPPFFLNEFPYPFVRDKVADVDLIVAASNPHPPARAAHTIDAVGGISLAGFLGRYSVAGEVGALLDYDISHFDGTYMELSGSRGIISLGGETSNMVTEALNRTLPVVTMGPVGSEYVKSLISNKQYSMSGDYFKGEPVTDYGYLALGFDSLANRPVMVIAGISGFATRTLAQALAKGGLPLSGTAEVFKLTDKEGDGVHEAIELVEVVWSERAFRGFSSLPDLSVSNLPPIPYIPPPFIAEGSVNASIVVAASNPHFPENAAHTLDVVSGIVLAAKLGRATQSGYVTALMDVEAALYDSGQIQITAPGNLIALGGETVNLVTRALNASMPIVTQGPPGSEYIYVKASSDTYFRQGEYFQGVEVIDQGYYSIGPIPKTNASALVIAGLSGFSTRTVQGQVGGRVLPLTAAAGVATVRDLQGDGVHEATLPMEVVNGPLTLASYPRPYADSKAVNATFVVAASWNHTPAKPAHTIDVVGGISIATPFARGNPGGQFRAVLDTEVVQWDGSQFTMAIQGNLILLGSQTVNLAAIAYNQSLPIATEGPPGGESVKVYSSGNTYAKVGDYFQGTSVLDYAYVSSLYDPFARRYVLQIGGISGFAVRSASTLFAAGALPLRGSGLVLELWDYDGDAVYESWKVREEVGPIVASVASLSSINFGGVVAAPEPTNLASLFVDVQGNLSGNLVVAASNPHPPAKGGSTIDAVGGILLGMYFGRMSMSGVPRSVMDSEAVDVSSGSFRVTLSGSILSVGGETVNLVSRAFNATMPIVTKGPVGAEYVYVKATGNSYSMSGDYFKGTSVIDFAYVALYYDSANERWVVVVAGISGFATRAICDILSSQTISISGSGLVVRLSDYQGDTTYELVEIVETVP